MTSPATPAPSPDAVEALLHRAADELAPRFSATFSRETVGAYLRESYALLEPTAKIKTHLPNLAIHFATERLAAAAKVAGAPAHDLPAVLFVCVHNAGRSQMAAALLEHRAAGRVHVRSAGSAPAGAIDLAVSQAMADLGLNLALEFPKPLTDEVVRASDVVVTMGCGDACPIYLGKRYLNWELDDPEGQPIATVRRIRDEIDAHVQALLDELAPAAA
jgi:arsenate reductase (thioredoxin)